MQPTLSPAARRRVSLNFKLSSGLAVLLLSNLAQAQSFGLIQREKVQLHRKLPAVVHLTATSFTVTANAPTPSGKEVADLLPYMLESDLLKNEPSLRSEKEAADVTIACVITNYETPPKTAVTRNDTTLQKGGKLVTSPKVYDEYTGQLDVSYKVTRKSGKTIDSNSVSAKYSREFEQKTNQATKPSFIDRVREQSKVLHGEKNDTPVPPTPDQLRQELIHRVVAQISPRLVNTDEVVDVYLASGKGLSDANKLAANGQYSRYLEALETMTPFPSPEEDAYRIYDIGVANEALGYQADDRTAAKKFFSEAAIDYGKAIEAKPSEKNFLEPQTRVETAVAYYKTLSGQVVNASNNEPVPPAPATATTHNDASDALTNQKVIEMFKSGVDEDSILAEIRQAPKVDFKLGPDDLIALANNGIKGKIPAAMRERMHPSKPQAAHK